MYFAFFTLAYYLVGYSLPPLLFSAAIATLSISGIRKIGGVTRGGGLRVLGVSKIELTLATSAKQDRKRVQQI